MKIVLQVTIEISDPDDWTMTFGVEGTTAIRQDVKEYVGNGIQQLGVFRDGEISAEVTWR